MAASFLLPLTTRAQNVPTTRPTTAEAQALLQNRPDLLAQLRQRFASSGLSKDQVHARLKAEGYPEDLLDAYLPGFTGQAAAPDDDVFRAVRALGVVSDSDLVSLQALRAAIPQPQQTLAGPPPTSKDTIEKVTRSDTSAFNIFGLDLFRSSTSQFQPALAGSVDANYRLGPGDQLVLIITGEVEASYQLDVTREGFVVIPQVGQVYVANLTLGDLQTLLRSRLTRVYSGIGQGSTRFSVSVSKLRTNQVFVIGEAVHPGSYMVSSAGTALTALYAAGGPSVNGSLRQIQIRRQSRVVDTLDVYDYLLRGDASHDIRLETGDVLFIPVHGTRARIAGEVLRPATYELEGRETLDDLIRFAGGFAATASRQRVLIERIVPATQRTVSGRDRITVDVSSASLSTIQLYDGDVVQVFPIYDRVRNRIIVTGNVPTPGPQALTPGMRVSEALRKAGGVLSDTYLGELLISRTRPDGSLQQLRTMLADTTGRVTDDLVLQEDDSLSIWSVNTFRPARYVAIGGDVRKGGRFPYREGMTLRDLILQANGLRESAYLKEAEIARLPESRANGVTANTIHVPLDSTYLPERKPNAEYLGPPGFQVPATGAPEIVLKPYDNVLILRQPNWELQRTVVVQGEVKYPGTYALIHKTERLSDIIGRAGGLTDEAYAEAMVFSRSQYSLGQIGVDLPTALRNYNSPDNLLLRDGDTINVRQYLSVVTIRGAVNQPTTVAWLPGKDIDYYINSAGGATRTGDDDHAYVQQPNGKYESVRHHFLRPDSKPRPLAGAVVVVPVRDPADKKDYLAIVAQVGQVLAGLFTLVYLARQ